MMLVAARCWKMESPSAIVALGHYLAPVTISAELAGEVGSLYQSS